MNLYELPCDDGLSLADRVFLALKRSILALDIKPREYLVIGDIATRYGISRTPVREAFIRLEREGWLRTEGRRGARVLLPATQTLLEIVETEAALEAYVAGRAAELITDEQIVELEGLLEEADSALAAGQLERSRELGSQFQYRLYAIVGNSYLRDAILELEEQMIRVRLLLWNVDEAPVSDSAHQHHEILDALKRRDREAAYQAMYQHTLWFEKKLASTLERM